MHICLRACMLACCMHLPVDLHMYICLRRHLRRLLVDFMFLNPMNYYQPVRLKLSKQSGFEVVRKYPKATGSSDVSTTIYSYYVPTLKLGKHG